MTDLSLGTDPHMLRRNDHPDTSDKAAHETDSAEGEWRVLKVVRERWENGLDTIGDDVLEHYGVSDQRTRAVSESGYRARFSGLERKGYICLTGAKRDGHRFGKLQQCWRPMSDEEREAFLEGRRDFEDVVIDDAVLSKLTDWWKANNELQKAVAQEEASRAELISSLLDQAPLGKYEFDLPNECLLTIELLSGKSKVTAAQLTPRQRALRMRRIAERMALKQSTQTQVDDTFDSSEFYTGAIQ